MLHPFQFGFVLPALPPFFFKGSDVLIKYPFILVKSLHPFPSIFLSGDSHEDPNGASSYHSLFLLFSGGFNSSFVDHIPFLVSMLFHAGPPINHPFLAIQLFQSAKDISEGSSCHSRPVNPILRMFISFKLFNSTGAISPSNHFNGVFF